MQPPPGSQRPDRRRVVAFRRAEQGDCARPLASERARSVSALIGASREDPTSAARRGSGMPRRRRTTRSRSGVRGRWAASCARAVAGRRGAGGSRRGRVRAAARRGRRPSRRCRRRRSRAVPRSGRAAPRQTRRDEPRRNGRGSDRSRACRGARNGTTAACGGSRMDEVTWCALGGGPCPGYRRSLCASRHPRQAVCAGDGAARHRRRRWQSCSSASPARSSSISCGICRAASSTAAPRRRSASSSRTGSRRICGARRGAPAGLRAPALPRAVHRRHRHADPGLFQRQGRPARAAVADRRRARRQRPGRVLRRHAADGAPRPRVAAGRGSTASSRSSRSIR